MRMMVQGLFGMQFRKYDIVLRMVPYWSSMLMVSLFILIKIMSVMHLYDS